jgi:hypothetical protein
LIDPVQFWTGEPLAPAPRLPRGPRGPPGLGRGGAGGGRGRGGARLRAGNVEPVADGEAHDQPDAGVGAETDEEVEMALADALALRDEMADSDDEGGCDGVDRDLED